MGKIRKEIYVIGHKNPDTDCVCASIAYAYLKNEILRKLSKGIEDEVFYTYGMVDMGNYDITYVPRAVSYTHLDVYKRQMLKR